MIIDLSSLIGGSINDKKLCSRPLTSVMVAAQKVPHAGQGALLAKMDLKQAYLNIPVAS